MSNDKNTFRIVRTYSKGVDHQFYPGDAAKIIEDKVYPLENKVDYSIIGIKQHKVGVTPEIVQRSDLELFIIQEDLGDSVVALPYNQTNNCTFSVEISKF